VQPGFLNYYKLNSKTKQQFPSFPLAEERVAAIFRERKNEDIQKN
jgi:hypothetical protein